jgi:hypothetical protein
MYRTALFATLALASGLALAQNVAVVNGKPIPKAREDAWVKELTKQGQADTPELRKMVKERLKFCCRKRPSAASPTSRMSSSCSTCSARTR